MNNNNIKNNVQTIISSIFSEKKDESINKMNSIQEQKIIDYKNKLKEEANHYFDFSSINHNEEERKYELKISEKIDKIACDIEKIIYENK